MKKLLILLSALVLGGSSAISAQNASINIKSKQAAGLIDEKLYGQLFEHIYFAPNNGAWQELIFERSFEPEMYPGINPTGGYFSYSNVPSSLRCIRVSILQEVISTAGTAMMTAYFTLLRATSSLFL